MSKDQISLQVTDVVSDQQWAADPDMLVVMVRADLLAKAAKCVAFMVENDVASMLIRNAVSAELYALTEGYDEDDLQGKKLLEGLDGKSYVEFEPEYRLDGRHARIHKDGEVSIVMPFKHEGGALSGYLGDLKDLQQQLAA